MKMRGSGVPVGVASDLREGHGVKEAVKNFFLSGITRSGSVCGVCLKGRRAVELGEEVVGVVLQALLLLHSLPEKKELKGVSPLWVCAECSQSFNSLTNLLHQLDGLRIQFNDLRKRIGREVIVGTLGRSEEEWVGWEEESKGAEHIFPSLLTWREENKFVEAQEDVKSKMVVMKVEEDASTFEDSETIWIEGGGAVKSEVVEMTFKEEPIEVEMAEDPLRLPRNKRRRLDLSVGTNEEEEKEVFLLPDNAFQLEVVDSPSVETNDKESLSTAEDALKSPKVQADKCSDYTCPRCGKMFTTKDYVHRHIANVHEGKKVAVPPKGNPCTHCHLTFPHPSALKLHLLRKHFQGSKSSGDPQCPFCLKFFPDELSSVQHQRKFHFGVRVPPTQGHPPQNLRCFLCKTPQSPLTPEELKTHEESEEHTAKIRANSSAFCDVCRLNFGWDLAALKVHVGSEKHQTEIRHVGKFESGNACLPCRKKFSNSNQLTFHLTSLSHAEVVSFRETEETAKKKHPTLVSPAAARVNQKKSRRTT